MTFGDTFREPELDTAPMRGVVSTLSALVDDHVKVVLSPRSMELGEAEIVTVGGGAWTPSIPPPSGILSAGTAESERLVLPNRNPSGANGESSSDSRNHDQAAKGAQDFVMDSNACRDKMFLSGRRNMLPG